MDCARCGTSNMNVGKFCRRCGEALPERERWVLGTMSAARRKVRADRLRQGRIVDAGVFTSESIMLDEAVEALLEAVQHYHPGAVINLIREGGTWRDLIIEGDEVLIRFRVQSPYAWVDLTGPRDPVKRIVRRVAARYGEELFAARDGRYERFHERTGVSESQSKETLLDLLS